MTRSSRQNRPDAGWTFDNSYTRLPEDFYVRLNPVPVRAPKLVIFNAALAQFLGLNPDALKGGEGAAVFSGNRIPEGAEPLAQAYAGHQFGSFTMLGDGRAIVLGEQVTPKGERVRHPVQRVRQDPVFATGGRAGGIGADASGVYHQRGHARPGHTDDPQPCGGDHR
jgi:hypothetical protein